MGVHPRAVLAEQRLRHEGRMPPVLHGVLLDRDAVRHAVVRHLEGVGVAHVDLVLRRAHLVVRVLDVNAQLLQRQHRLAAHVGARVERREVEVPALVQHLGDPALRAGVAEVEELELRPHVEVREPESLRAFERAPQDLPGIALVGLAAGRDHVAEHARHAAVLRPPGEHREGGRVGHGDHVRLLDGVEARDRRAVEAHPALEGVLQLLRVHREALELPQDVREPQPDEADVTVLDEGDDVLGGLRLVGHTAPRVRGLWRSAAG